jgi:hypothetical protein
MDYYENITYTYEKSEGMSVTQELENADLTQAVEKFVWFLKAAGFAYVGAYVNDDGDIVITKGGDVDLEYAWPIEGFSKDDTSDYWDDLVDEVASEFNDEFAFKAGDRVYYNGNGPVDRENGTHGGRNGQSLISMFGTVIDAENPNLILVEFAGWNDGHGCDNNRWWVDRGNLVLVA